MKKKQPTPIVPILLLLIAAWMLHSLLKKGPEDSLTQEQTIDIEPLASLNEPKSPVSQNVTNSLLDVESGPKTLKMRFQNSPKASERTQIIEFSLSKEARALSFRELLYFLENNDGHLRTYVLDRYDCKHFAHKLYEDALKKKIRAYFVTIDIANSPVGHAIAAFQTTDQGMVFVDFTPAKIDGVQEKMKRLVWLEPGKRYLNIPLDRLPLGFQNRFDDFQSYQREHDILAEEGKNLERDARDFRREVQEHNRRLADYNARVSEINQNRIPLSQGEQDDLMLEKAELDEKSRELQEWQEELNDLQEGISRDVEDLGFASSKWVVKNFRVFPQ